MDLHLKDLKALVTGASRGLGYAAALTLAREGCRVAINSRDDKKISAARDKMAAETSAAVFAVSGDVTSPEAVQKIVAESAASLGGLDILITNSGGPQPGLFDALEESAWQKAVDLCLMSHVRLIRAALPYLRKSKFASVLTVTSYSVRQPIQNLVLSNSVRSATVGLTKSLALELGGEGIRFNSILPGWTETERVVELMTARAQQKGTSVEAEIFQQTLESPLKRMGSPQEFANAAAFLVSPAASYITGVMLTVDGGMYKGTV
jgi:3-oxoacyl-[acyl-carrier protein] reductase